MAMTPEEQNRMVKLETLVDSLLHVENVPFIKNLERRLNFLSGTFKLSDATDVTGTDTATIGQVLKKTATTWQPGTDEVV